MLFRSTTMMPSWRSSAVTESPQPSSKSSVTLLAAPPPHGQYRLYKRRFSGLLGFVRPSPPFWIFSHYSAGHPRLRHWNAMGLVRPNFHNMYLSNILFCVSNSSPSFITAATEFGITVDQVNWLSNVICCVFIPVSLSVPIFCSRYGITRCVCAPSVHPSLLHPLSRHKLALS